MSLFFGIPISDEADLLEPARALPGRVVPAQKRHITLLFLGELEGEQEARVLQAVHEMAWGHSFWLRTGEWGAFPSALRARVIWVGFREGNAELARLSEGLEACMRQVGIKTEERAFTAHLTWSRLRRPQNVTLVLNALAPPAIALEVREVVLYESREGRYVAKASWKLEASTP